jgi:hypothetical protein
MSRTPAASASVPRGGAAQGRSRRRAADRVLLSRRRLLQESQCKMHVSAFCSENKRERFNLDSYHLGTLASSPWPPPLLLIDGCMAYMYWVCVLDGWMVVCRWVLVGSCGASACMDVGE